mgnify:CR=1 FL=1
MARVDDVARIPPQYRNLIDTIGEEATRKLCATYGGEAIYIPKLDAWHVAERAAKVAKDWNGCNLRKLARENHLTVRSVQRMVQGRRPPEQPGQLSMMDYVQGAK